MMFRLDGGSATGRYPALIPRPVSRPVCHPAVAGSDTGLEASSPGGARCHGLTRAVRSLTNLPFVQCKGAISDYPGAIGLRVARVAQVEQPYSKVAASGRVEQSIDRR